MAGVKDSELVPFGPWPEGIDNLHKETEVKEGALRAAVNVDLSDAGKASTRGGFTKVIDGSSVHSLWHEGNFPYAMYVDGDTLKATTFAGTPIAVRTGMAPLETAFDLVADRVYWSNNSQTGIVRSDLTAQDWGIELPGGQPNLSSTAGSIFAGNVQVAVSFQRFDREESGMSLASTIDLADGSGIVLANIPQPIATDILAVRVYATLPNGDVLYHQRDVAVGMLTVTLSNVVESVPARTQFLEPMPPGRFVTFGGGRMFTLGDDLSWSEVHRLGLTHRINNRIRVGGGTLLKYVANGAEGEGLYFADKARTYFIAGPDINKAPRQIAYPYPAIPGSQCMVPGSKFGLQTTQRVLYWVAQTGTACIGLPGGVVMPLREDQTVAPRAEGAASIHREQNGLSQVLTALRGGVPQGMAVRDAAAATVHMNGITP